MSRTSTNTNITGKLWMGKQGLNLRSRGYKTLSKIILNMFPSCVVFYLRGEA